MTIKAKNILFLDGQMCQNKSQLYTIACYVKTWMEQPKLIKIRLI